MQHVCLRYGKIREEVERDEEEIQSPKFCCVMHNPFSHPYLHEYVWDSSFEICDKTSLEPHQIDSWSFDKSI